MQLALIFVVYLLSARSFATHYAAPVPEHLMFRSEDVFEKNIKSANRTENNEALYSKDYLDAIDDFANFITKQNTVKELARRVKMLVGSFNKEGFSKAETLADYALLIERANPNAHTIKKDGKIVAIEIPLGNGTKLYARSFSGGLAFTLQDLEGENMTSEFSGNDVFSENHRKAIIDAEKDGKEKLEDKKIFTPHIIVTSDNGNLSLAGFIKSKSDKGPFIFSNRPAADIWVMGANYLIPADKARNMFGNASPTIGGAIEFSLKRK